MQLSLYGPWLASYGAPEIQDHKQGSQVAVDNPCATSQLNPQLAGTFPKTALKSLATGVAAASTVFMASGAMAGPITTVVHNVNIGNNYVSQGTSISGQFNINNLLPGVDHATHEVVSAKVQAYGYSSASPQYSYSSNYTGGYTRTRTVYSYSPRWSSWGGRYYVRTSSTVTDYYRTQNRITNVIDNVRDTMRLTSGNQTSTDAVDTHQRSYVRTGGYSYSSGGYTSYSWGGWGSYSYSYTSPRTYTTVNNYRNTDMWYGALDITQILNQTSLDDLSLDGLLNFNIGATAGQFQLTSLKLTAELSKRAAAVPEPGTLSLALLGLLAGGASYRRRRLAAQAQA